MAEKIFRELEVHQLYLGLSLIHIYSEEQYELIRELLEPEFGPLYVTPPDIDETVKQLSFTISEGIHRAVF